MAHELVTFGETMVLVTPEADRSFDPGQPFVMRYGGAESNMAIAAARLGIRTAWHSRLGQDPLGAWIRSSITAEGVDTATVEMDQNRATGLYLKVRTEAGGHAVYYYRRHSAASAMEPESFPYELIAKARWLHVSGITPALSLSARAAWRQALAVAREHGVPISLDPNLRLKLWTLEEARSTLLEAIGGGVDLLLPNLEEGRHLFGDLKPEELVRAAQAAGARRVALKNAAEGALLAEGDELIPIPPTTNLPVVDPVGAGDAFAGGLVAGLLRGLSFRESGQLAAYCGARAVTQVGDWEALPTRDEVIRALEGRVSL